VIKKKKKKEHQKGNEFCSCSKVLEKTVRFRHGSWKAWRERNYKVQGREERTISEIRKEGCTRGDANCKLWCLEEAIGTMVIFKLDGYKGGKRNCSTVAGEVTEVEQYLIEKRATRKGEQSMGSGFRNNTRTAKPYDSRRG